MTGSADLSQSARAIVFEDLIENKSDPAYVFEAEDVAERLQGTYGIQHYNGVLEEIEKILSRLYGKGIEPTLGKNAAGRHHWKFGKGRPPRSNLLPVPGEPV